MNEEKIIQKLMEHDQRFGEAATEFKDFKNQVFTAQDEMLTILRRLDQERIFTSAWLERMEKEIDEHKQEIKRIKEHLKI